MTLTDPREALADQSSFISYLMGLAGLGRWCMRWQRTAAPRADQSRRCRRPRLRAARPGQPWVMQ